MKPSIPQPNGAKLWLTLILVSFHTAPQSPQVLTVTQVSAPLWEEFREKMENDFYFLGFEPERGCGEPR